MPLPRSNGISLPLLLAMVVVIIGTPSSLVAVNYTTNGSISNASGQSGDLISYTYDAASNITAMTVTSGGSSTPVLTSNPAPFGYVGAAFSHKLTSSKTASSFSATGLPSGLVLTASTGLISGTPKVMGVYPVNVTVTASGVSATSKITIQIRPARKAPIIQQQPIAQAATLGQSVTLFVSASGSAPFAFQWKKNGVAIAGATGMSYTINSFSDADIGSYTVTISNTAGSVTSQSATLSKSQPLAINGEAFGLPVSFIGTPAWFVQSAVGWGGQAALQSGAIGNSSSTSFQTTVTGPGVFVWRWKVSSEENRDGLIFSLDGVNQAILSGEQDWQQQAWLINSGSHALRWTYTKDGSGASGQDRGWISDASFSAGWYLGMTVNGSGSVLRSTDSLTYANGAAVKLTPMPAAGWKFSGWSGALGGATAVQSLTMNGHKTVTATFTELAKVSATASASPPEGGTTTGTGVYNQGSLISLIALPNPGWVFVNWTENGTVVGTKATFSYSAATSRGLIANFVKPAMITSHVANGNLGASPVGLAWDAGYGATEYWLVAGTKLNGTDLYNASRGTALSQSLTTPTDGRRIYVNLRSKINGAWMTNSYVFFSSAGPVVFQSSPVSQLVALGSPVSFASVVTGALPQSYSWRKNGVALASTNSTSYNISSATLAHAAAYTMTGTNGAGTTVSSIANLGVVDAGSKNFSFIEGATITLSVPSAGTGLSYIWKFGATALTNGGRVSGATTSKLVITNAVKGDVGAYTCTVSSAGGVLTTGAQNVWIISKPVVTAPQPPPGIVSGSFSWQLSGTESPTRYSVTGLPSGLVLNAASGLVSGTPNVSGSSIKVKVTAINQAGSSPVVEYTLSLGALPDGTTGNYSAWLSRRGGINASLGGYMTLTINAPGTFTGSVRNGADTHSITGRVVASLAGDPTISHVITRSGKTALTLTLTIAPSSNSISGTLEDKTLVGYAGANVWGKRHIWTSTSASAYATAYNSAVDLPAGSLNDTAQPLGVGWQQMSVAAAGTASGTGRTPDGVAYSFAGTLWPDGSLPQLVLLYSNKGSVMGLPRIVLGTPITANRVVGWVDQVKTGASSTSDRTYASGIPYLERTIDGAPYVKPTALLPIVLGLPDQGGNGSLVFSKGDVESAAQFMSLAQTFRITTANVAVFAPVAGGNPCNVKMTIVPATGLFSGSFALSDLVTGKSVPRTVNYFGILLSHRAKGYGYFLLPGLLPSTTASNTLGGRIQLN